MDVEQVIQELYGLTPEEFTSARDAYVAEARKAKDTSAAKAIAALRRPVLAAWAANLLARRQPDQAQGLLRLGETLREAHRTLDAAQLRSAARQQHQLIGALARTAAELADAEGHPVSDTVLDAIEQTLHGVLADPEVAEQWAKGRLVKVPEAAVGFPAVDAAAIPPAAPAERSAPAKRPAPPEKPVPDRAEARRRALEQVRAAAEEADAEVRRREGDLAEARAALREAEARAKEASDRVRDLERALEEARPARQEAARAVPGAQAAVKAAEAGLDQARRAAEEATRAVRRREGGRGGG